MLYVITTVHVIVCFFLIIVVLLQSGKAADLAGAFGGMGSQTVFGPRGTATVLSKATTVAAILFMVTSLSLAIIANNRVPTATGAGVLEKYQRQAKPAPAQQQKAPAAPVQQQQKAPGAPASTPAPAPAAPKAPGK
jgi:preprotein translocase subunit SecG